MKHCHFLANFFPWIKALNHNEFVGKSQFSAKAALQKLGMRLGSYKIKS